MGVWEDFTSYLEAIYDYLLFVLRSLNNVPWTKHTINKTKQRQAKIVVYTHFSKFLE